jgi:hypothetical protein
MRPLERAFLLVALAFAGCAKPIPVRIEASGPTSARLEYRRIDEGAGAAQASTCQTPCSLSFEPDSVYELELRAEGFQRARLAIEYRVMLLYERRTDGPEGVLVIPMLERPR